MSQYVVEALQKPPPAYSLLASSSPVALSTASHSSSDTPRTPETLCDLFTAMAAATNATLISDVVIAPRNIKWGPAKDLFMGHTEFTASYFCLGHTFEFGFLKTAAHRNNSATTFPIFTVDPAMIGAIPQKEAEPLLRGLQCVLGVVNHDMLHHFTSCAIDSITVYNKPSYTASNPVWSGATALPEGPGDSYEKWALQSQENVLRQPAAKPLVEKARVWPPTTTWTA